MGLRGILESGWGRQQIDVRWEDRRDVKKKKLKHKNLSILHTTNHQIVELTFSHGHSEIVFSFIPLLIHLYTLLIDSCNQPTNHSWRTCSGVVMEVEVGSTGGGGRGAFVVVGWH